MPFKSEKQRKWMHTNEPKMAKKWEKKKKMKKETKVRGLIRKMVQELLDEQLAHYVMSNIITEKKLAGGKSHLVQVPIKEIPKVKKLLSKKFKEGKQWVLDVQFPKKKTRGVVINHKIYNQALELLMMNRIKVREGVNEDFAGSYSKEKRHKFDKTRREQSEVLGYTLTGKDDIRSEVGDATIKEQAPPQPQVHTGPIQPKTDIKDNPFDDEEDSDEDNININVNTDKDDEEVKEARDYKDEYKKFQSSDKSKKYRAELNAYNRKKGTYGNGDGKDASHKGGKIVGFEKESVNRGRAEKSRLKKEGKLTEDFKNNKWEVYVADEKGKEKIVKVAKSKRAGVILYNKLINSDKYHEVGMRVIKEGKLTEGRFKLSGASEMQWGGNKIVIMAGNKKIVLNKNELKNLVRGLKMHRLGEEKLKELNLGGAYEKMILKHNDKMAQGALHLVRQQVMKKYKVGKKSPVSSEKVTRRLVATHINNGLKELRNKAKSPGLKKAFQKIINTREAMLKTMKEGKLTEGHHTIFHAAEKVMKDKQAQKYKSKKGMVMIDMQTANLLTKVWKKVNPKMKKILSDLGEKNPAQLVQTLWAVVK